MDWFKCILAALIWSGIACVPSLHADEAGIWVASEELSAGKSELVSQNQQGRTANGSSVFPAVSNDGRYVVFQSAASNIAPGDGNGKDDVFLFDRNSGSSALLSRNRDGRSGNDASGSPDMSGDGRLVVFDSLASDLTADPSFQRDIYLYKRGSARLKVVSKAFDGGHANGASSRPRISPNGNFIVFQSQAGNLLSDKSPWLYPQIYRYSMKGGRIDLASPTSSGDLPNAGMFAPSVSSNGRYVVYQSAASNIVANDTNGLSDVFLYDFATGQTEMITKSRNGGPSNGSSEAPRISANGRFLVFHSTASNLVRGDTNDASDVFVHDIRRGVTTLVSKAPNSSPANGASVSPDLTERGRYIVYTSFASNLQQRDRNSFNDIFVYDRRADSTALASFGHGGGPTNGSSTNPRISRRDVNGVPLHVVYDSFASNIVMRDRNRASDAFQASVAQ